MPYKPPIDMGNSIGGKRDSGKKRGKPMSGSMMAARPNKKKPPIKNSSREDTMKRIGRKADIMRGSGPATRATDGPRKSAGGLAGRTPAMSPKKKGGAGKVKPKARRLDTPDAQAYARRRKTLPPTR